MNVIIVKKDPYRDSHPLFSFPLLVASFFALFVVLIGVAYVAYHYGGQQAKLAIDIAVLKSTPAVQASVAPMLSSQSAIFEQDKELIELAAHLGDLQAQIIQLNEISKQLIEVSQLDAKEFDFTFNWEGALTEEQIIALEDLPEEVAVPETKVAVKQEDKKDKAEAKLASIAAPKPAKDKPSKESTKKEDKQTLASIAAPKPAKDKPSKESTKKEDKQTLASIAAPKPAKDKPSKESTKKEDKQTLASIAAPKPAKDKPSKETTKKEGKQTPIATVESKKDKPSKVVEKDEPTKESKKLALLSIPDIKRATKELGNKIEEKKEEIAVVEDILLSQRGRAKILPAGWPIRQGYFSSGFGMRGKRMHKGVDLVTKSGTNIYAVEDGEVTFSGQMRGYGNMIEIKHGNTYSTRYGHNSRNMVKVGDRVKKGQVIGLVGATGRATTAHVHFELLRSGSAINPMKFLAAINSFQLAQK